MKSKRTAVLLVILIISLFFYTGSSLALTTGSGSWSTDFRFNNPGARALGMGGAFIGVADDATAAFTNPAGLTILTRPELAAEYKYTQYKTTGNTAVIAGGVPSGVFLESTTTNDVSGVSFLSFAYPTERATFTLFRHELVNLKTKVPRQISTWSGDSTYNAKVDTYGIAAGFKIVKGFSLGLNVGFSALDSYTILPGSPDYYKITDSKVHGSAGLFWNPFGEFNVGAVYRYGPEFKYPYAPPAGGNVYEDNLKIPDAYGLGLSYRFFNALTLAADVNYIRYSQMMKDYRLADTTAGLQASDYKMDDAIEVSAGLEYAFSLASVPVAVRGGYRYSPFHERYYDGPLETYRNWLPKGKDEHSFSAGIGAVLGKNFQLDFAGSWSDVKQDYIMSLVYRF